MSTAVIAGLIWIGFVALRPSTAAVIGALQQSMTRYPNIAPGEEFTGYT